MGPENGRVRRVTFTFMCGHNALPRRLDDRNNTHLYVTVIITIIAVATVATAPSAAHGLLHLHTVAVIPCSWPSGGRNWISTLCDPLPRAGRRAGHDGQTAYRVYVMRLWYDRPAIMSARFYSERLRTQPMILWFPRIRRLNMYRMIFRIIVHL